MSFTIAFDVPESEGPTFPSRTYPSTVSTLTPDLSLALRFVSEQEAEEHLASSDVSWSMRQWGVVVEVDQP